VNYFRGGSRLSRAVNKRTGHDSGILETSEDDLTESDYLLEVVTTEKNEPRVRALVLQTVDRPKYTLRSLDIRTGKSSQMKVLAGVSSQHPGDTQGLEVAVQRISLDPKATSSRWWPVEAED